MQGSNSDLRQRITRGATSGVWYLGLSLGLLACSGGAGSVDGGTLERAEGAEGATDAALSATELGAGRRTLDRSNLPAALRAMQGEVDTLLLAAARVEERAEGLTESSLREGHGRVAARAAAAASAGDALSGIT